jgi:hypothetical protein
MAIKDWSTPIASHASLTLRSFWQISSAQSSSCSSALPPGTLRGLTSGCKDGCSSSSSNFQSVTTATSTVFIPGRFDGRSTIASKLCADLGSIMCSCRQHHTGPSAAKPTSA